MDIRVDKNKARQDRHRQALIDKMGVAVAQREVVVGAIRTAYLTAGSGPTVICLHGGGAGAVTWYPAIGALSIHFHVIAPDIVGYGESDKPDAAYDRPYFAHWLKQFLAALRIPKAHIVGLSQGGAIALQFAHDFPAMVDKLVLVAPGALGARTPLSSLLAMLWMNIWPSTLANRIFSRYLLVKPDNRNPHHGLYSIEVLKRQGGKNAFAQGRGAAL